MSELQEQGVVCVLLATFNGAAHLDEQLGSLEDQDYPAIDVIVSDDGSTDGTLERLAVWRARWRKGRFEIRSGPRLGFAENFRSLIINLPDDCTYVAFCDQDDIWEADKLSRAVAWLAGAEKPRLFCSRTLAVSEDGVPLGPSALFTRPPAFRNAIVQSLAGANTMVMNRTAAELVVEASRRTAFVSHDWWSYLVVSGAGGEICFCPTPLVRYRQHTANQVGANIGLRGGLSRVRRLLRGQFREWMQLNLAGLAAISDLLEPDAQRTVKAFECARTGNAFARVQQLRKTGAYRQSRRGTCFLYVAAACGWL